jgi:LysR family glycine cleavage system transcriptional activator
MQTRFRRIQTLLTPLRVLEAAARQGSFTKAAEELGLSQPSVSRHIASLEQDLGTVLFLRDHNKLTLTEEGRTLASSVDLGLSHILAAVQSLAAPQPRSGLTLACTHSFAHGWLLPRFSDLRRAIRDVPINLVVSYWLKDIVVDEIDLIVSWRTKGWTDWARLPLFDEVVYPVCAPAYLIGHPELASPESLLKAKLLNYDVPDDNQIGWEVWFSRQGCAYAAPRDGYQFSNYHFMIQAAMDGEGVALGWHHLVADQIAENRLIKIGPAFRQPNSTYTLEYRRDRLAAVDVVPVLDWFRKQAGELAPPD